MALTACGARTGVRTTVDPDAAIPDAFLLDARVTPAVHGKFVLRYFPDSGEVDLPKDLTKSILDARVAERVYPGVGFADGTFSIANVPPGQFMLRVNDTYIDGAVDGVTLSTSIAGRPDADRSDDLSTVIKLDLQNLAPLTLAIPSSPHFAWDAFSIQSTNAGCSWSSLDFQLTPKPALGATSLTNAQMRGQTGGTGNGCHIDASKGDTATLLQIRTPVSSDPMPHVFTARKLDLPGFVGPNNKTVIDGTMIDVVMSTFHGDLRPSTFTAVAPTASVGATIVQIRNPGFSTPPLGYYPGIDGPAAADGPFDLAYPDPFPTVPKQLYVYANASVPIEPLDPKQPANANVSIRRLMDLTSAGSAPIVLVLSPPTGIRIGDAQPLAPVAHAGTTPTIHWSPPTRSLPGPLRYVVSVGNAKVWTTATSVVLPSGVLAAGNTYQVVVQAMWTAQPSDFSTHPLDGTFPESALASSGVFSP